MTSIVPSSSIPVQKSSLSAPSSNRSSANPETQKKNKAITRRNSETQASVEPAGGSGKNPDSYA